MRTEDYDLTLEEVQELSSRDCGGGGERVENQQSIGKLENINVHDSPIKGWNQKYSNGKGEQGVMAVEIVATYQEWKQNFLAEINSLPNNVAKGDEFVRRILQIYYSLSEEDAIDATECAGAGDKGVDAVYIIPSEDDDSPNALVVQGKYGVAGTDLQIYQESQKFFTALKSAYDGTSVTPAIDKIANVQKNGGLVRYVIATVEPLDLTQQKDLGNSKKLAHADFGDKLVMDAISLEHVYSTLGDVENPTTVQVALPCLVVPVKDDTYVGVASLVNMYVMLRDYAKQSNGAVDTIYDRNIRKYLKRRTGSVNDGIYKTLENEPPHFIAYNNGITIICHSAQQISTTELRLERPYIVNGCQTTRTLYDFMDTKFAGINPEHDPGHKMAKYREAFIAIKVLVVEDTNGEDYANAITRYSNKQNAIRGKDFIALEDLYKRLKAELKLKGFFLETQAGGYEALPKHQRIKFPRNTNVINSFEATLFFAAGVLGKPHLAFGRSGDFMPDGREFDKTVEGLKADDLLVPWMIGGQARDSFGYTAIAKRNPLPENVHREQTRYFFLFIFFRLLREVIAKGVLKKEITEVTRQEIYELLKIIKNDYDQVAELEKPKHPFLQLLSLTDEAIATYMALAEAQRWYSDRNSFLKREELIREDRIIVATGAATLKIFPIAKQIQQIMSKNS